LACAGGGDENQAKDQSVAIAIKSIVALYGGHHKGLRHPANMRRCGTLSSVEVRAPNVGTLAPCLATPKTSSPDRNRVERDPKTLIADLITSPWWGIRPAFALWLRNTPAVWGLSKMRNLGIVALCAALGGCVSTGERSRFEIQVHNNSR
jgi:hypothetical protein